MNSPEPLNFRAEEALKVELNEEYLPSVFHVFLLDKEAEVPPIGCDY